MNSGLPSLLDAIFGKEDLASVSLTEMYEVISEFPSFNAAHFLLSKKLGLENNASFEKESMRTALYFNNPLWLQSLLEEENHGGNKRIPETIPDKEIYSVPENVTGSLPEEEAFVVIESFISVEEVEPPSYVVENVVEEPAPESPVAEGQHTENFSGTVSSFDELISKYKIEIPEPVLEEPAASPQPVLEMPADRSPFEKMDGGYEARLTEPETVRMETREEVLNDYGIFEESLVKETDHDQEAFDRPQVSHSLVRETIPVEIQQIEIPPAESENIIEHTVPGKSPEKSDEGDYDAFDKPVEPVEPIEKLPETAVSQEALADELEAEADDTNPTDPASIEQVLAMDVQIQELVSRFGEKQKTMPVFDAKKAESIVFAPYHMIDYFASQGIKLVMEDHPADNFGKQLKSFTDWLKVMKKLPVQTVSEKQNEKESDRIRHFAAHSIEERDILTESMAEVLAKQGMYENAIALFQKLSLIYPPKSAYFASRIEQLKASLP